MNYILFVDKVEYIISDPEVISLIIFNSINIIHKIYNNKTPHFDIKNVLPEIKVSCYESFFRIDDLTLSLYSVLIISWTLLSKSSVTESG